MTRSISLIKQNTREKKNAVSGKSKKPHVRAKSEREKNGKERVG